MPHDERGHEYHMVKAMLQYLDLFLDYQVPGILPWHLLAAQCRWESSFNPFAVSSAGARGIAQFMPETWSEIGQGDPFGAEAGVKAQSKYMLYLAMLHTKIGRTTPWWWVVSYTWGFGRVQRLRKHSDIPVNVRHHAGKVIRTSEYYQQLLSYTDQLDR